MVKYVKGKNGQFAGSIGDGKAQVPTASDTRIPATGATGGANASTPDYAAMAAVMEQNLCAACGSSYGSRYHEVSCGGSAPAASSDMTDSPFYTAIRNKLSTNLSGRELDAHATNWFEATEGLTARIEQYEDQYDMDSSDAEGAVYADDAPIGRAATAALFDERVPATVLDTRGPDVDRARAAFRQPQPGDQAHRGTTHTVVRTNDGCTVAVFRDSTCLGIARATNANDGALLYAAAAAQITR